MPFTFNSLRLPKQARPCDGPLDHPNASTTSLADKRLSSGFPLARTKSFLSRLGISSSETRGDLQSKRETVNLSTSERLMHRSRSATPSFRRSRSSIVSSPPPLNTLSSIIMESDLETRAINSMQLARSLWRHERIQTWRMSSASLSAPYSDKDGLTPFKGLDPSPAEAPSLPPTKDEEQEQGKSVTLAALYEAADALLKCLAVDIEIPSGNTPSLRLTENTKVEVRLEICVSEPIVCAEDSSRPAPPAVFLTTCEHPESNISAGVNVRPLATTRKGSLQRRTGGGSSKNRYLTQLVARSSSRIRTKRTSIQDRGGSYDCLLTPPESTLIVYNPSITNSCTSINFKADDFWIKTVNNEDHTNRIMNSSSVSIIHDAFRETLPGFHEPLTTSVSVFPQHFNSLRNTMKSSQTTADFLTVDACYFDGRDVPARVNLDEGGNLMKIKSYSSDQINEKRERRSRRRRSLGFNGDSWPNVRDGLGLMDDVV
ncbi:hypothetical protein [Phaffia rhodozyma]|uniref:Uncharacterized protein n=1 Tax=Phaffia rhodozyma TaxID=264483 RepID=A0A0F7SGB5_PHARH|nr:hypothetical protein [Phaffia rhodozyma]